MSTELSKISKNYVMITLSKGILILTSYFVLVAVARYLSLEDYGNYAFVLALVTTSLSFSNFGIQEFLVREVAQRPDDAQSIFGNCLTLRFLLLTGTIVLLIILVQFLNLAPKVKQAVYLMIISEFFFSFNDLLRATFQAFERMQYDPVVAAVRSVVILAAAYLVVKFDLGFLFLFLALIAANFCQFAVAAALVLKKFVRPSFAGLKKTFWRLIKASAMLGLAILLHQTIGRFNVLLLKWVGSTDGVAYFQAPYRMLVNLQFLFVALGMAVLPALSRLFLQDRQKMTALFEQIIRYTLLFETALCLTLTVFAKELIIFIIGSKFEESIYVLQIVCWSLIPMSLDLFLFNILVAMHKAQYRVLSAALANVVAVAAALIAIPAHGHLAAAWNTTLSYLLVLLITWRFVAHEGAVIPWVMTLTKTALSCSIAAGVMLVLKPAHPWGAFVLGNTVFFGVLIGLKAFRPDEIASIRKAITAKKNRGR